MRPDSIYELLVEIEQAATSCLDIPYCSMVWAGCSPPGDCANGLSISVSGSIGTRGDDCTVIPFLEATIAVNICSGDPQTYAESTIDAEAFYGSLSRIFGGLLQWYTERNGGCSEITPDGFRCGREEGICDTYYSTWRIKL